MKPALSIIVVTYNSHDVIREFIESLAAEVAKQHLNLETIIIDNASKDGTQEFLSDVPEKFAGLKCRVVINESNTGLSQALNYGGKLSQGDTLLMCNPDIRFDDSLAKLIHTSIKFQHLVIFPELVGVSGAPQRAVYMRFPTRARIFMTHTTIGGTISKLFFPQIRDDYHYRNHVFRRPLDRIEQGAPVCMIIPRPVALKLSPMFDPRFPVFWNDVDLSVRARDLGVKFAIAPEVEILHRLGHSIKRLDSERRLMLFYSSAGLIGFLRKWKLSPRFFQMALLLDAVYMIVIKLIIKSLPSSANRESLRRSAIFWVTRFRCSLR